MARHRSLLAAAITGSVVLVTIAQAGSLPGFSQVGCWNTVVSTCERAASTGAKAMCQHDGFSACNSSSGDLNPMSLDRIREALPSFTASRIIVQQSSNASPVASNGVQ